MNLKKFRSALLASVAAAFMITGVMDTAYASKHASGSSRILSEDDILQNIENSHHAYKTPGACSMRVSKVVESGNWTMQKTITTVNVKNGESKGMIKFYRLDIPSKVTDEDIEKATKEIALTYIKDMIRRQATAFDNVLDNLRAWSGKTDFAVDDDAHNVFKLLSVSIDGTDYSLFNEDMFTTKGKKVASYAYFYSFLQLGHAPALAKHVLAMIEAEVSAVGKASASTPKSTPKKAAKFSGTPKVNPLLKTAQINASKKSSTAPLTETPVDSGTAQPSSSTPVLPTQPLPTGGFDDLVGGFDDLLGSPTTLAPKAKATPTPQPKAKASSTTPVVDEPTKAKATATLQPKAKASSTTPVVAEPTEEEIQNSVDSLIDTKYRGLRVFLSKRAPVLALAKDLLQKDKNAAKVNCGKLFRALEDFEARIKKVRSGDLAGHTTLFTPYDLSAIALDAEKRFKTNATLKRTTIDDITFVTMNRVLHVSDGGKLYTFKSVLESLENQREEVTEKAIRELKEKRNALKLDPQNALLLEAYDALESLRNEHPSAHGFLNQALQQDGGKSSLSFDAIIQAALKAEAMKK